MGSLSWKHDPFACKESAEKYRQTLSKLKNLVGSFDPCDGKDISGRDERFPPDWAVPLITYPMTKERDLEREKWQRQFAENKTKRQDTVIINGRKVNGCICGKRNGLQADCELQECQGNELCLIKPYPLCEPSGNAEMYVTPEQAETIFSYLSQRGTDNVPSACKENEPCDPKCVECNASLRNICKWNPGFFNGSGGGQAAYTQGGYNGNGGMDAGMNGSYNNYLFTHMKSPCTSSMCNPCPNYAYASWCCPSYPPC